MIGLNVRIQCPYCKKILYGSIGAMTYYKYENKEVIIQEHDGCGDFLCIPEEYNPLDEIKKYSGDNTKYYGVVKEITQSYMKQGLSEEDIIQKTLNDLKEKFGDDVVNHMIDDMKLLIQISLGQQEPTLWSVPLTEEMRKSLEVKRVIYW